MDKTGHERRRRPFDPIVCHRPDRGERMAEVPRTHGQGSGRSATDAGLDRAIRAAIKMPYDQGALVLGVRARLAGTAAHRPSWRARIWAPATALWGLGCLLLIAGGLGYGLPAALGPAEIQGRVLNVALGGEELLGSLPRQVAADPGRREGAR